MSRLSFLALGALAALQPLAAAPVVAQQALPEPRVAIANPYPNVADLFACMRGKGMFVSAHRGGVGPGYPENALETIAHTLAVQPVLIETDIHATSDGVLVMMHDDTLDRTSTGTGPIRAQSWAALQQLRLKDNDGIVTDFRIPRLRDALAWFKGRALLLAEVKESDTLPQIVAEIRAAGAQGNVMLLLNSIDDAARLQQLDPTISMTLETPDMATLDRVVAAGVNLRRVIAWTGIGPRDTQLWQAFHQRGMTVSYGTLWFVDTAVRNLDLHGIYAGLANDGVDLLATDRPLDVIAELAPDHRPEAALRQCRAVATPGRN